MNTLLLVDDDSKALDITQRFLKAAGFAVTSALGGKRALELLQNEHLKADMVIIDLDMKMITGKDVANECIARAIPFILLSGLMEGEECVAYLNAINYSFSDLLHKPTELFRLNGLIKKKLNQAV